MDVCRVVEELGSWGNGNVAERLTLKKEVNEKSCRGLGGGVERSGVGWQVKYILAERLQR